jgi:small subunit ribosomal protein S14
MAKKSKIAANERRKIVVARHAGRRAELKETLRTGTPEEKARAHLRKFGLFRIRFRELAHRGELPGVTKSSW